MTAWAKCQNCGSPMRWGVTTGGARMPLDPEPTPDGNVWIFPGGPGEDYPSGRLIVLDEASRERALVKGHELYMPHHATCPGRGRHAVPRAQMRLGDDAA